MKITTMRSSRGRLLFAAAYFSLLAGSLVLIPDQASAQLLQGALDGNVTDSSQAAIVGASVVATNQETQARREIETNSAGGYSLPTLPPGTYTIAVRAPGFQFYTQTGVAVAVNSVTRVDVVLTVGQLTETVSVSAQVATLQTDRSDVRAEVTLKTLQDVPVPLGRNYQMLVAQLPGIAPPENTNSFAANPSRSVQFSVNGTSLNTNATRVDGASAGSVIDDNITSLYVPALEAIETVSVVTNSFDAEQGLAGGGGVNIQMKSGSNAIHGSLFEFHTDQHTKAYAWNGDRTQRAPKFIYNQFGGTNAGRIMKDKLFYLVSFEGTRYSENATQVVQVPTAAMKTGNLSASPTQIYDPSTGSPSGSGRVPFTDKIIPLARIDVGIQNLIKVGDWPLPNRVGGGAFGLSQNYLVSAPNGQTRNQYDEKLTWNATSKLSMFFRFGLLDHSAYGNYVFGTLGGPPISRANTGTGTVEGRVWSGTMSGTYILTPHLIIDGYFGYQREEVSIRQQRMNENLAWTILQIPGLQSSRSSATEGGWPAITIAGWPALGSSCCTYDFRDPQKKYSTNIIWVKGMHNLGGGFDSSLQDVNEAIASPGAPGGALSFAQGPTQLAGGPSGNDFNAFASFLLGLPSTAGKTYLVPPEIQPRTKAFSFYVRDRWTVTPKLTVNIGTRWEYFPFPRRVGRGVETYDFTTGKVLLCGLGPNPIDCGINYRGAKRFAPRLGVAYRITPSLVFRGGYGMTNDPSNLANPLRYNYPDLLPLSLIAPNSFSYATTLRQGVPAVSAPDLSSGVLSIDPSLAFTTLDQGNLIRGYIQSWNFMLEKGFGGWIASAGYVATRSVDQLSALEQNWAPIGTGAAGLILNKKFGRTASTKLMGTLGTAKYDSLQMRAVRRFAQGYQISANYTFGKGLGYLDENGAAGASPKVAIPYLYRLNYGLLSRDVRHNFQVTGAVEAPFGAGKPWFKSGPGAFILGGWQVNAAFSAYTGAPFTVSDSGASLNAPGSTQFGDCISTPQMLNDIKQWYDKSAFAPVKGARFGTCGPNNLRGPSLLNADLGFDRKFKISERFELKFRAEVFNATNTPHHGNPGLTSATSNNVSSGSFMLATDIRNTGRDGIDERTFRFGLRLGW